MFVNSVDRAFRRFQETGDSKALALVFDATAPELQRLARYLASPEAPAEDLLQATYLTAIEAKQRFDSTQRVLPWLVGILVNHAREARRRNRREFDPERLPVDVGLDPSDEASTRELSLALDQGISRLPEAQRSVLRLHLQQGLELAQIARSLARPPGTVRAQLSRGLKQLRRLLPESLAVPRAFALVSASQLEAVRVAVLSKAGGLTASAPTTTSFLTIMATSLNKKIILGAAVLLVSFLAYRIGGGPSALETAEIAGAVQGQQVQQPPGASNAPAQPPPEARAQAPLIRTSDEKQLDAPRINEALLVHITDGEGIPMPDVGVAIRLASELQNPAAMLDFRRTDAAGSVGFSELPGARLIVETDRNEQRSYVHVNRGQRTEVTLALRGVRVTGSVVDARESPMADATIWAHAERLDAVPIARTDARGEFFVDCVSPGVALQARKQGFAASKAHPVLGSPGEHWNVRLSLGGEATELTGRVLDPHGAPVAGALVAFVPVEAKELTPYDRDGPQVRSVQVRTRADGTFHNLEVPRGSVIVTAAGRDPNWTPTSTLIEVGTTPERIDLRLGIGAILEGTITDGGKSQADCSIFVLSSQAGMPTSYLLSLLATRVATSDSRGKFHITGILPGQVEMRALRNGMEAIGQQTIPLAAGETCRWDLDCSTAAGTPFEIAIEPKAPGEGFWLLRVEHKNSSNRLVSIYPTEPAGRARIERLEDGRYKATVLYEPTEGDLIPLLAQEFDAREKHLTLRIPAERLRFQPVRGRLVDASAGALKERSVELRSLANAEPLSVQRTTDITGNFSFRALPPGHYSIYLLEGGSSKLLREFTVIGDRPEDLGELSVP